MFFYHSSIKNKQSFPSFIFIYHKYAKQIWFYQCGNYEHILDLQQNFSFCFKILFKYFFKELLELFKNYTKLHKSDCCFCKTKYLFIIILLRNTCGLGETTPMENWY